MDFLKGLFEEGPISWEQFEAGVSQRGFKVADLSKGNYVAKKKYEDDLATRDSSIESLTTQLTSRIEDIETLKKQMQDGTASSDTRISELTAQLDKWQADYTTAKQDFETRLSQQAYEFAARELAADQKFTSSAARRDFERAIISANLGLEGGAIAGADDFVKKYRGENADAFIVEPDPNVPPTDPKPKFMQPTPPTPDGGDNPFKFNFSGI